jgi:hypothetical protein
MTQVEIPCNRNYSVSNDIPNFLEIAQAQVPTRSRLSPGQREIDAPNENPIRTEIADLQGSSRKSLKLLLGDQIRIE